MTSDNLFESVGYQTRRQTNPSGLTSEQVVKLERLRLFGTRYELVATHTDGRRVLIGYTPRKGRDGLFSMLAKNGEAWVKFSGVEDITFGKRVADGAKSGDWTLRFSGRTQREAIIEGELPFFHGDPMSAFGKQGTRCDTCGKFSRNKTTGEYVRKDGSQGYIWPDEDDAGCDICDDCLEAQLAAAQTVVEDQISYAK